MRFILRTPVTGDVGRVFQAAGVALPPNIHKAEAAASTNRSWRAVTKRRGANDRAPARRAIDYGTPKFILMMVLSSLKRLVHV